MSISVLVLLVILSRIENFGGRVEIPRLNFRWGRLLSARKR